MRIRFVSGSDSPCEFCLKNSRTREFTTSAYGNVHPVSLGVCEGCLEDLQRLMKGESEFET